MRTEQVWLQPCGDLCLNRNSLLCRKRLYSAVQAFDPAKLLDMGVAVINGSLWTISLEMQSCQLAPWLFLELPVWVVLPLRIGLIPCFHQHLPDSSYSLDVFHMPLVNVLFGLIDSVSLMYYIGGSVLFAAMSLNLVKQSSLACKPSLRPVSSLTCVN